VSFRHGEVQMPELLPRAIELVQGIGEDAIDAVVGRVQPLVVVGGPQCRHGGRREIGRREPMAGARVGEVEMQPEPAVVAVLDRLVDGKLLGCSVGVKAEGPDQAGNRLCRRSVQVRFARRQGR
jgi:hypothetical protein